MKSSEVEIKCPICDIDVKLETLNLHISQMARREKISLKDEKPHLNYLVSQKLVDQQLSEKKYWAEKWLTSRGGRTLNDLKTDYVS